MIYVIHIYYVHNAYMHICINVYITVYIYIIMCIVCVYTYIYTCIYINFLQPLPSPWHASV